MTEEDLLIGITDALTVYGWRWTHTRRSDRSQMMGHAGVPDIVAVHPERGMVLAWELKATRGRPHADQVEWIAALSNAGPQIDARVIWPAQYDAALDVIAGTAPWMAFGA